MENLEFDLTPNAALSEGLVLLVPGEVPKFLRITHVFEACIYGMWIDTPEKARYARRPFRISKKEIGENVKLQGWQCGRVNLPAAFMRGSLDPDDDNIPQLVTAWLKIEPLIRKFQREENLARSMFTALIRERAGELEDSHINVLRLINRYYYFGATRRALISLPRGTKPGTGGYKKVQAESDQGINVKRRGPQSILSAELGQNDFIVDESDIDDIVNSLKYCLRQGPTTITRAHEIYLSNYFKKRHPEIYLQYLDGRYPEPVTDRQYRYYISLHAQLSNELAENLRTHNSNPGSTGSVRASGPCEIYEIDATGGRIHLVAQDNPNVVLGKPVIYVIIDRWSRYIVAVYVSLRPASWEEVRYALLIAFTSRERRFKTIGVDIDNERWVVGQFPAVLCMDRGSEFLSESMENAVAQDLRVELMVLPPLCPDGKAIVERLIREIKRRMSDSELKGTYADRPMDPKSKRAAKKAAAAAVHSIKDVYRTLIEIVDDHNNRPHRALRKLGLLKQANVPPVPRQAYIWGLKNITGLRTPPLTEQDYRQMLLGVDDASLGQGVLRYKKRLYQPVNEVAVELVRRSTARAKGIKIRVDKTDPAEVFVVLNTKKWAHFEITPGSIKQISGLTLDEEEALSGLSALNWARADHESRVARLSNKENKVNAPRKVKSKRSTPADTVELDQGQRLLARQKETAKMKKLLVGSKGKTEQENQPVASKGKPAWLILEEQDHAKRLEIIQRNRKKK